MNASDEILAALSARDGAPSTRTELLEWAAASDSFEPPGISRFLFALFRSRADLQHQFHGIYLDPEARLRYLLWAHHFAAHESGAPPELIPPAPSGVTSLEPATVDGPVQRNRGVGVLGYLKAVHGLGAASRRLASILHSLGEPLHLYPYDHTLAPLIHDRSGWDPRAETASKGSTSGSSESADVELPDLLISVLGPHELPLVPTILGAREVAQAKRVALFFWETDSLPAALSSGFDGVSEVWVTSEYTAEAVRPVLPESTTLHVVPIGASVQSIDVGSAQRTAARSRVSMRLGVLPSTIVAAQIFDYSSGVERKNPLGLAIAWSKAFPKAEPLRQTLVFKTIGAQVQDDAASQLRTQIAALSRSDVLFVDEALRKDEQSEFMERLDLVGSLHRAEGYGLVLLEAMFRGIPVIASAYSGNLAFMNESNSWMIPCTPTVLERNDGPYPAGSRWGEPDLDEAATAVREVVSGLSGADPTCAEQIVIRTDEARKTVTPLVDGTAAATAIRQRLADLRAGTKL